MKNLLLPFLMFCCSPLWAQNQSAEPGEKIILENEQLKVIEHVSWPKGDVCGEGVHHHEPHLTVVLTDAKVRMTPEGGEPQIVEVKSGTSIWFDAETHSVTNAGDQPTKMILVYLKN